MLCLTHGEASTLSSLSTGLPDVRKAELAAAADKLGVRRVELLDHPDGALSDVPLEDLVEAVSRTMADVDADLLLVFDEGGVTGHPDHRRATEAALAASNGLPVLAWGVPVAVGAALNRQFATAFVGSDESGYDVVLAVDRRVQLSAIACHSSQSTHNPVLWRRLELLGENEYLRWLVRPSNSRPASNAPATIASGAQTEEP